MAERSITGEYFVQIGITALRDPAGAFLPAVPLYIKVDADQVNKKTSMSIGEEELCADISGIFAERFGQYVKASRMEKRQRSESSK